MKRLRIRGTDRAIMKLCQDARKRWLQYGENRKVVYEASKIESELGGAMWRCNSCGIDFSSIEIDHIKPLGSRPRTSNQFGIWLQKLLYGKCQALCKECHLKKRPIRRKSNV